MDTAFIDKVKRLVIVALASDDELVETLVLKGGNAIDLVYRDPKSSIARASYDLDYSIEGDFENDLDEFKNRLQRVLEQTFLEQGYQLFDFQFIKKPSEVREDISHIWGGYAINFKLLDTKVYQKLRNDKQKASQNAIALNPNNSPKFEIEISKYEYVGKKQRAEIDGYSFWVYSPAMIIGEKVRALCQQLPDYNKIIPTNQRPRPKDFYDILTILEMHPIDFTERENVELLQNIFAAKKVPLEFIHQLRGDLQRHRNEWKQVVDTISSVENLEPFDYYADRVVSIFEAIPFPPDNTDATV